MRTRMTLMTAVAAALASGAVAWALQDHDGEHAGQLDQAQMEALMKYMQPGEAQAMLATRVGKWNATNTHWMAPGAPPNTSEASCEYSMMLGGRMLKQEYSGNWGGMPFEGLGYTGFNNATEKFEFVWMDNFSTGMMRGDGAFDGKALNWTAVSTDPMTGKPFRTRGVETFQDPDKFTARMYADHDGTEFLEMEIVYTRATDKHDSDHGHEHGHGEHDGHGHDHDGHGHDHDEHDGHD